MLFASPAMPRIASAATHRTPTPTALSHPRISRSISAISGRGLVQAAVLVLLLSTFLGGSQAVQYIVGGDSQWSYLHPDSPQSYYSDWAANKIFSTGDSLVFQYDNTTHTVLQLATGSDFLACNLKASITKWTTGHDIVFISKAGTYYYVCGAPSHCEQGMKFSITATGDYVAAPPGISNGTTAPAPTANHASPTAHGFSGAFLVAMSALVATIAATL